MNSLAPFRRRRARRGMVLLEVMVALDIFGTAALALVIALNSTFDAAADRNRIDLALRGLDNQIVLLHSARVTPGETDLPDDGTGVLYHLSVAQEQITDQKNQPVPNMYRVVITAKWTAHGQADERSISTLVYQP